MMPTQPLGRIVRQLRQMAGKVDAGGLADRQLLQRFLATRDEGAFEVLLQRHGPLVWGLCLRLLRHRQDAEDAFQATFLTLARSVASIRKHDSLASWLYGVAYRVSVRARGRAVQRACRERQAAVASVADALDELTGRELCAALDEELARLPERYRAPLLLCCLDGRTRDEAARELGLTLATLKRRLEQGRALLQSRLSRRGLGLSVALTASLLAPGAARAAAPAALLAATGRGASLLLAGKTAAGVVSTESLSLATATLRLLLLGRIKSWLVVMAAVSFLAVGAGLLGWPTPDGHPNAVSRSGPLSVPRDASTTSMCDAEWTTAGATHDPSTDKAPLANQVQPVGSKTTVVVPVHELLPRKPLAAEDEPLRTPASMTAIVLPAHGLAIVADSGGTVRAWELPPGRGLRVRTDLRTAALSLSLSPQDSALAWGGQDWQIALGATPAGPTPAGGQVHRLSPGTALALAGKDWLVFVLNGVSEEGSLPESRTAVTVTIKPGVLRTAPRPGTGIFLWPRFHVAPPAEPPWRRPA